MIADHGICVGTNLLNPLHMWEEFRPADLEVDPAGIRDTVGYGVAGHQRTCCVPLPRPPPGAFCRHPIRAYAGALPISSSLRNVSSGSRLDQTVRLADGRILGFAEYGSPDGAPLLVFHGLPGSRLAAAELWLDEPTTVRVIAPDRPGFGLSTFQPGRGFLDWADDVRQLADSLGLERFLVAGFSSGGAHALAVAVGLPDRVLAVGSIAGSAPMDPSAARASMPRRYRLASRLRRAPSLVSLSATPTAFLTKHRPGLLIDRAAGAKTAPQADREALADPRLRSLKIKSAPEAFRQGGRGYAHEIGMYVRPWDFDVADVKRPVLIWHGEQDAGVPVEMAHRLATRIPDSSLTLYPGEGHLIVPRHWDEILTALLTRP